MDFKKEDYAPNFDWDQPCPKCSGPMQLRFGRFGAFLGCTKYPECKGIVNISKKDDVLMEDLPPCPAIGCDGKLAQRRSRFGKPFFSCSNYPDCDVIVSDLEDLPNKYIDHPKTPYVKKSKFGKKEDKEKPSKEKKKKKSTRVQPAYKLSKDLQAIVGAASLSRPEVTKKVWEYIKANKLQDPKHKRLIIPDAKLAKIFGNNKPLDMMQLARVLNKHID
ncbi:MAG: topoisomerase DNA-binding C4 zinc finger domain-containing protein [Rhabdochlamydiaceae bacterium]